MKKGMGPGGRNLSATDQGAEVGAVDQGAEVDATDQGAEPLATSDATFVHVAQELYHLGAAVHGAEVRVHFLKSFQKRRICEILFKKGPKRKKKTGYFPRISYYCTSSP
jgi:hypothetical protein